MRSLLLTSILTSALAVPLTATAHDPNGGHLGGMVDCSFGAADGFGCARIDLLSWLDLDQLGGSSGNDIWGWTDPMTGREYVLMGRFAGTTFVDITDPQAPIILGDLPAHPDIDAANTERGVDLASATASASKQCSTDGDGACGEEASLWRDIKVYADHAYIVSEQFGAGLQVFDLTQLRNVVSPPVTFGESGFNGLFSTAHNVAINLDTGFLYAVGTDRLGGAMVIFDLSDPASPAYVADYTGDGYTHDIQCVIYAGPDAAHVGQEICFASNEDTLTILDVTDKSDVQIIRRQAYSGVAYSHQAALSEDQRYLFSNDELDELSEGGHTRTHIWDVRDLETARVVETYESLLWTIDHNNYVVGDYLYQSNYTSGLRVLDVADPTRPWEVGFFDTFPANDAVEFDGSWSNYAFFPSGTIAVSDISNGLFLLQADFLGQALATSDLAVDLGASPGDIRSGDTVQWVLTVSNASGTAAPDAQLTLSLDGPLSLISFTSTLGSCVSEGDTGRCMFGTLNAGSSVTVTVTFGADASGRGEIAAMVSGLVQELDASDNRAGTSFSVAGSSPSDSGGGGSGPWLVMLLALAAARPRRRSAVVTP
jgi:choice-of-anchor B domain-containing protein